MGKIYTGIELGSSKIKVLVLEAIKNSFYVLSSVVVPTKGIKKKEIVDPRESITALQTAIKKSEEQLGMKIEEAILVIPPLEATFSMEKGSIEFEKAVSGYDLKAVLKQAVFKKHPVNEEIVNVFPISFSVDDGPNVLDPKGTEGHTLSTKVVMATMPKEILYSYIQVVKSLGIKVVDTILAPQADYQTCETKDFNRKMGAIINIGEETSTVSIYNKGIIIKNEMIKGGSLYVDKDLSFIYKVDLKAARKIKETFAITASRYADNNEWMEIETQEGKTLQINQTETSKIIEARLTEILKLAKSAINNLTKREISYIIILGGISELAGFAYLVEDLFGSKASVWNMNVLGARHNQFSTVFGSCKYYHQKCTFQEEEGSMFTEEAQNNLLSLKKKGNIGSEISLNKFFGHFLDN